METEDGERWVVGLELRGGWSWGSRGAVITEGRGSFSISYLLLP